MESSNHLLYNSSRVGYEHLSQFSKTDKAYLALDNKLDYFYKFRPEFASFKEAIELRKSFATDRKTLAKVIENQYKSIEAEEAGKQLSQLIIQPNTYTVTTAHQPSLLLGPLYYVYKILHTVLLSRQLKDKYPEYQFIPTFVIGGEDHDFEEVNHTYLYHKKIEWTTQQSGSVGLFDTKELKDVLLQLQDILPQNQNREQLITILEKAYLGQNRYFEAAQSFIHQLFGHLGVLVIHMYDENLKAIFKSVLKDELLHQSSQKLVQQTVDALEASGFKNQAFVRDINLFYILPQSRERIVIEEGIYKVLNTDKEFTQEAILEETEQFPNRFSPNVVLRPLFQEMILPNLAYIGGGGEIAYWLERKQQFEYYGVPFPILIRRQSALILDKDVIKKIHKLGIAQNDLFLPIDTIIKDYIFLKFGENLTLQTQKESLQQIYNEISQLAEKIDPTLRQAVLADATKQVNNLESWESRLIRTLKQKQETAVNQLKNLNQRLFPNGGLQERHDNFIPYFAKYGFTFFDVLLEHFKAFDNEFLVLSEHEDD